MREPDLEKSNHASGPFDVLAANDLDRLARFFGTYTDMKRVFQEF